MIQLNARIGKTWVGEPFVARVTTNRDLPEPLRDREAIVLSDCASAPTGFRAILHRGKTHDDDRVISEQRPVLPLPASLDHLSDGDVIRVVPHHGEMFVLYRRKSQSNSMLLTDQCNSNCLMCSQPPKPQDDSHLVNVWLEAIPLMSRDTPAIGITGGEPTLRGDGFLKIVRSCKLNLSCTSLHILSNGRLFNYLSLCRALAEINHPDMMIGIPVYSDIAHIHDFVVQAGGAFDQTIRGIINLKRFGIRVEVRVVLHRQTIDRLPNLARYITRNLMFVDHVALMGLEMMGHVKMNMDALWIDPFEYQASLMEAVTELSRHEMNVSIYNHQLCLLPRELWPFARKSISDWKNEYLDVCDECAVKSRCGGFFSSAKIRRSDHIAPIKDIV
jgi:His-Xaa-Ser system radical SAM maturase HxsC